MSLQKHRKYKDSGIPWIGSMPADWKVLPLLGVASERCESNAGMKEGNLLSLSYGRIVNKDMESNDGLLPESFETYQIVRPGDVVFRLTDLQNDKRSLRTAPVSETGIITSAYLCIEPRSINPRYFAHLLRFYDLTKVFYSMGGGLRQSMKYDDVKRLPVVVPSQEDQVAIAEFLDRETAKIDALIAEQEKLLALLAEKRQATISHAVTRGLDPDAAMKDSNVPWLGDIPVEWERAQLGRLCHSVADGPHFSPKYVNQGQGVMFISARNVRIDGWSLEDAKYVSEEDYAEFCKRVVPEIGDVLYTKGGTTGTARVVDISERFQVWVHIAVLKIDRALALPEYVAYSLNSIGCYEQSQLFTRGATNQDLGLTRMVKIWLALPPVDQQEQICRHLDSVLSALDALKSRVQQAITLLGERRSALIAAAVTGKIDVRNAVPREAAAA